MNISWPGYDLTPDSRYTIVLAIAPSQGAMLWYYDCKAVYYILFNEVKEITRPVYKFQY